jgi:hypothetical protein
MFCPQCGTDSASDQRYCRSCGANLKVIAKAVTLGDAISRTDGVPAKIKEIIGNIKIEKVTDEVSRAMERMNQEITRSSAEHRQRSRVRKEKTAAQRRERQLVKGIIQLFWGGGLTTFLYFLAHAMVLRLPPDVIAKVPFEIDPVVRVIWLVGIIPMLSGVGHIISSAAIRSDPPREIEFPEDAPLRIEPEHRPVAVPASSHVDDYATTVSPREAPPSVTDRTTNILEHQARTSQSNQPG